MTVRLFQRGEWGLTPRSPKPWYEIDPGLELDPDLSLVELIGSAHGTGHYLLVADHWSRELVIVDDHAYREER